MSAKPLQGAGRGWTSTEPATRGTAARKRGPRLTSRFASASRGCRLGKSEPTNRPTEVGIPGGGVEIVDRAVKSCLHPFYDVEHGITRIIFDPEKRGQKIPAEDAFAVMGRSFDHLVKPEFEGRVPAERDRREAQNESATFKVPGRSWRGVGFLLGSPHDLAMSEVRKANRQVRGPLQDLHQLRRPAVGRCMCWTRASAADGTGSRSVSTDDRHPSLLRPRARASD